MSKLLFTLLLLTSFSGVVGADSAKVTARNAYVGKMLNSLDKVAVFVKGAC